MNKIIQYRGYKFNIKVELNTRVERRPNGNKYHTVTTDCMEVDDYLIIDEVGDNFLIKYVTEAEILLKKYVDDKTDGVTDKMKDELSNLGFK